MTSKSARIRALYAEGKSTWDIACAVFKTKAPTEANRAYVRVAGRQRDANGLSKAQQAYREKNPDYVARSMAKWSAHGNAWKKTAKGRRYSRDYTRDRRCPADSNQIG